MPLPGELPELPLSSNIRSRRIDCTKKCGLQFHILESGWSEQEVSANKLQRPLLLLIHGFPEIAFSWRKVLPLLAAKGYHVVAPDQRGFGRTTGWEEDVAPGKPTHTQRFSLLQLVVDMLALVEALGYTQVATVVGHDFGGVTAAQCALLRPDVFRALVLMSHPFKGMPAFEPAVKEPLKPQMPHDDKIHETLALLDPPRKHYKWYNSTEAAPKEWDHPPQGLHEFLREYAYVKSADWSHNDPQPLKGWTAEELLRMPEYYILPSHASMPEAIKGMIGRDDPKVTERWLSDQDLAVYAEEWRRTGFRAALYWYRCLTATPSEEINSNAELTSALAGRKIDVPCAYMSGEKDWGNWQEPGALDGMKSGKTCSDFRQLTFIPHAGHWPQQEQPDAIVKAMSSFLDGL